MVRDWLTVETDFKATQSECMWRGFIWLEMRTVLGSFEYGNKPFGFMKNQKTNGLSGENRNRFDMHRRSKSCIL